MISGSHIYIFFSNNKSELLDFVKDPVKELELTETCADDKLIIASTPELGSKQVGAYASKLISKGEIIGPYDGIDLFGIQKTEIINEKVKKLPDNFFLLQEDFDDGTSIVIDAEKKGSLLRFVNHGQKPNAYAIFDKSTNTINFIADKDIMCGEEIIISYGDRYFGDNNKEIKYKGYTINALLNDLAQKKNVSISIPKELTLESIKNILDNINTLKPALSNAAVENTSVIEKEENCIYVDKDNHIHTICFLKHGNVLFIDSKEVKKSYKYSKTPMKNNCLIYSDSGKFVEIDKNIEVEDTGIITNQHGTLRKFWIIDEKGQRIQEVFKKNTVKKRKCLQNEVEQEGSKSSKISKIDTTEQSKVDLNKDDELFVYVVADQEGCTLESVKFEKINTTNYNRISFEAIMGDIKETQRVTKTAKQLWDERTHRCLVYADGPRKNEFVRPKDMKNIVIEKEDPNNRTKNKNQFPNTKYWLKEEGSDVKIELMKKISLYYRDKKKQHPRFFVTKKSSTTASQNSAHNNQALKKP